VPKRENGRLVFDVENVSTMRYYFIPILHSGELQSMYFLDRETDRVWRYYSIVPIGKNANGLIAGNESSSLNRAVAFCRFLVGIPTAQEPPGGAMTRVVNLPTSDTKMRVSGQSQ
jgi:hypothetical protein